MMWRLATSTNTRIVATLSRRSWLFYPAGGDSCRRMLFDNMTGTTADAPAVNCVPSEMNTAPVPGQEVNQTTDRVKEMSKHFNKQ